MKITITTTPEEVSALASVLKDQGIAKISKLTFKQDDERWTQILQLLHANKPERCTCSPKLGQPASPDDQPTE